MLSCGTAGRLYCGTAGGPRYHSALRPCLYCCPPSGYFSVPPTRTWLASRSAKKQSWPALLDRRDHCQNFFVGRLLASAREHGPPLCKIHKLVGILVNAIGMV